MFKKNAISVEDFNEAGLGKLPNHLGINVVEVTPQKTLLRMPLAIHHMAPNGFLHAGSLVTLADTACGYGCVLNFPEGANGFTTIELKSNHLSTARDGVVQCVATLAHLGKTTQVWDAVVSHVESGKTLALFRCTQMVLYPKA